jgi:hypothetical protein
MVKVEKNKYFKMSLKNKASLIKTEKYILPNKDFKKFSLDTNKVWESEAFLGYI